MFPFVPLVGGLQHAHRRHAAHRFSARILDYRGGNAGVHAHARGIFQTEGLVLMMPMSWASWDGHHGKMPINLPASFPYLFWL